MKTDANRLCALVGISCALYFWPEPSEAARMYIRVCNRGDIPVDVVMGSDAGLIRSKTIEGWTTVEPGNGIWGSASDSCEVFHSGTTLRNYYFGFAIKDRDQRRGMVRYQPDREGTSSRVDYSFCVDPNNAFQRTGSTDELQSCRPNEVLVPFSWGVSTSYSNSNSDNDVTIIVRPRASDPIASYLDGPGGSQTPHGNDADGWQSAQALARASRWAEAERALNSPKPPGESIELSADFMVLKSLVAFRLGKHREAAHQAGMAQFKFQYVTSPKPYHERALLAHQLHVFASVALNEPGLEEQVIPSFNKALAIDGVQATEVFWDSIKTCHPLDLSSLESAFRQALRQRCVTPPSSLKW